MLGRWLTTSACLMLLGAAPSSIDTIYGRWMMTHDPHGTPVRAEWIFNQSGNVHMSVGDKVFDGTYSIEEGTPRKGRLHVKAIRSDDSSTQQFVVYDSGLTLVLLPKENDQRPVVMHRPSGGVDQVRSEMQNFGLGGTWASFCDQPASEENMYVFYNVEGDPIVKMYNGDKDETITMRVVAVQANGDQMRMRALYNDDEWDGWFETVLNKKGAILQVESEAKIGVALQGDDPPPGDHFIDFTIEKGRVVGTDDQIPVDHFCSPNPPAD